MARKHSDASATVLRSGSEAAEISDDRCLLVIGDGTVSTLALAEGRFVIGRGPECDVVLDDPLVSRAHAALHVGVGVQIEDLGSANGTSLQEAALAPNTRVDLEVGRAVEVGSSTLLVQRGGGRVTTVRLRPHGYLEIQLEDACARRAGFALVRFCVEEELHPAWLEGALAAELTPDDVSAFFAPGEYQLLLRERDRAGAMDACRRIGEDLRKKGCAVRSAVAIHPEDGRTADTLLQRVSAVLRGDDADDVVILDAAMRDLHTIAQKVSRGTLSVLLLGETGVGKEIMAEAVHRYSPRRAGPFVRLNCAALSEQLLESELFGHERGAFTGAERPKAGLLETANGGSVFLDEIAELPFSLQVKLLRVIEQREVLRVGALEPRPIDVRFISATNRSLDVDVADGRFRQDLFFRLNGVALQIPPLRDRPAEIPVLAAKFAARAANDADLPLPELSARAVELLSTYPWPGNVRELRNAMERAVLLCSEGRIEPEHLPVDKMTSTWVPQEAARSKPRPKDDRRTRIVEALEQCHGNQTRAAQRLGVSRRTLSNWLDKYAIPRPQKGLPTDG